MALKSDFRGVDFANSTSGLLFMLRHLGRGMPLRQRAGLVPSFVGEARRAAESMLENHWRASDDLMARIGLDRLVRDTVEQSFERWDGRGVPRGLRGREIQVTSRLVNLADVVDRPGLPRDTGWRARTSTPRWRPWRTSSM
ncbi:MAG: hypothetical protein JO168_07795 [Solirubrobacterales bacterium]|nr:hypothetical protein [Solirubrobacterales bacterium]